MENITRKLFTQSEYVSYGNKLRVFLFSLASEKVVREHEGIAHIAKRLTQEYDILLQPKLPSPDILGCIFTHLDILQLFNVSLVCKLFHEVLQLGVNSK